MKWSILFFPAFLSAQSLLEPPILGHVLERGKLITVSGIAGNLIPHETGEDKYDDFADTGAGTWALREGMLELARGTSRWQYPVPASRAFFDDAAAWLPEPGLLVSLTNESLSGEKPACEGEVVGLGAGRPLTRVEGILTHCGVPLAKSSAGPALLRKDKLVYWHEGRLTVRHPDGLAESLPMQAPPERLAPAGEDWIHVLSASRSYLLRLTSGAVALYRVPAWRRP